MECIEFSDVSICLIDVKMFTSWCSDKRPTEIYNTMTLYNELLSSILEKHKCVTKVELVGDCVLLLSGINFRHTPSQNVCNMIHCACDILERILKSNQYSMILFRYESVSILVIFVVGYYGTRQDYKLSAQT